MKEFYSDIFDQNRQKAQESTDNTLGLFMALYLILLGFFIVLTSLSEPTAELAEPVLKSVNGTFKKIATDKTGNTADDLDFPKASEDNFLSAVNARLTSALEIEGRFGSYKGNTLEADIPIAKFYKNGSLLITIESQSLLTDMLDPLNLQTIGPREVYILFGIGSAQTAKQQMTDFPLATNRQDQFTIMRASAMKQAIKKIPFAQGKVVVGLVKGERDHIRFVFRHKKPVKGGAAIDLRKVQR